MESQFNRETMKLSQVTGMCLENWEGGGVVSLWKQIWMPGSIENYSTY